MVMRIQALWSAFVGAPGYTNFHFDTTIGSAAEINTAAAAVRTFFDATKNLLPSGLTVSIKPTAEMFDLSGVKTAESPVTTVPAPVVGLASGQYAAGVGAVINWRTGVYVSGRALSGRTFLVPLASAFQADGSLATANVTLLTNAANAYRQTTGPRPCVWALPQPDRGAATATISAANVPDRPAVLRSRR